MPTVETRRGSHAISDTRPRGQKGDESLVRHHQAVGSVLLLSIKQTNIITLAALAVEQAESLHWILRFSLVCLHTKFGRETRSGDVETARRQLNIAPDDFL